MSQFETPQSANENNPRKYSIDRVPTVAEISQDISEEMARQRKEANINSESDAIRDEIKKKEGEILALREKLAELERNERVA